MLLDLDLARPRRADLDLLEGQDFGPAVLVNPDRCDHRIPPSPFGTREITPRRSCAALAPSARDHRGAIAVGRKGAWSAIGLAPAGDAQDRAGDVGRGVRQQEQDRLGDLLRLAGHGPSGCIGASLSSLSGRPASAWIAVSIMPGRHALTRMPSPVSSLLKPDGQRPRSRPWTPRTRRIRWGRRCVAATDEISTIAPPCPPCFVDMRADRVLHRQQRAEHVDLDHLAHHRGAAASSRDALPVMPVL